MGNYKHDTLWSVFHKISHSALPFLFSPQHVGKVFCTRLNCGALAEIRGERLIRTAGIDLLLTGLGDGDHSSELSLSLEGIPIVETQDANSDLHGS